ncbi:MAG: alkaline phosphatase PhoX [Bacteroidota bacterium]
MKKIYALLGLMLSVAFVQAQISFDPSNDAQFLNGTVVMPASPLDLQVIFVGGVDMVQTTATYGNAATETPAKEWHDFIGFTPDDAGTQDLGWVSVNHERIEANDFIGDGGGMTVFKVRRDPATDTLIVVEQTVADGRQGKFFNVDFVNTVGNTGMNCGGITSTFDGRIWTAEEWFRSSNNSINDRDLSDFVIGTGTIGDSANAGIAATAGFPGFDGDTIAKYQNYNYMTEIDPRNAVAVRKQYNWGRQPFEGGCVLPDNKTVYLGADATPGFFTKFVADVAGDFTVGTTYVYKHDAPNKWVEIDNADLDKMLNFSAEAVAVGATMYNRLEWVAYNPADGNVYMTETGRDNPAGRWVDELANGAVYAPHHIQRAADQAAASGMMVTPDSSSYWDYYGRVLKYDVSAEEVTIHLEGGPHFANGVSITKYPEKHLSNPDGLSFITVKPGTSEERTYMVVQEDLNGTSFGRMPREITGNRACELFLLDTDIANPTVDDLVRITTMPIGSEVTGAVATPDGKTLLVNSQHPSGDNPFPYNHSLTVAINGFDRTLTTTSVEEEIPAEDLFSVYPNPVARRLYFNKMTDVAIFTIDGKKVKEAENVTSINVDMLPAGVYVIKNIDGVSKKLVIE